MTTWLGSINAKHSGNWDICKREQLFGSDRPAALNVQAGDHILIWGAERGWLARVRATAGARRPRRLADVPWPEPERYAALIPMTVVDEPPAPLPMSGAVFMAAAGVHTVQIRNFERLDDERAEYVAHLLSGRTPKVAPEQPEPTPAGLDPLAVELLNDLDALRVDRQLGRPAPYQQLVLLWAISRALHGHDRMQAYSEVRNEISQLLAPFAVGRTLPDPAFPWYALRTSRWWRLIGVPDVPVERGGEFVRRSNPAAGLSRDAHRLVISDPGFRQRAIAKLESSVAGHPAAAATLTGLFPEVPTSPSRVEEALSLLNDLRGQEISTTTGAVNRILRIEPPNVVVATSRSPQGQPVPIEEVQHGLDLLRLHGAVTIDVETLGHRSSFVGAVLARRADVTIGGSPPVASSTGLVVEPEPWDPDPLFEGETSVVRTVEARREQGRLRATLFGADLTRACALCGEEFPVTFLRAAHIKPRHACTEDERRQFRRIAMAACVFGCDALFEAGYVAVGEDGAVLVSEDVRADPTLSRRTRAFEGRRCTAHSSDTAEFFRWHREQRLRG